MFPLRGKMYLFNFLTILFVCNFQTIFCQHRYTKGVEFNPQQFTRHRTKEFYRNNRHNSDVTIRRASYFEFSVDLYKAYKSAKIQVELTFVAKRDKMVIRLPQKNSNWKLEQSYSKSQVDAKIYVPSNAPIGVWNMKVLLTRDNGKVLEEIELPNRIVVLFNPWSKNDVAYFPEQHKLEEYVMSERGYTYGHDFRNWYSNPWIFGQFQPHVMNAILLVLKRSELKAAERGDIVKLTREITYLLSDFEDKHDGVLRGRWKFPYDPIEGRPVTKPWQWTGSPGIYQQFYKSGGKAVGYGQCFVFAGILTTALRALGIASRPITNIAHAHTNNTDLAIDVYLNEDGSIREQDNIWNFHVWVQAWFKRLDMPAEYNGWQELDAVKPFPIGPASTFAVRNSRLKTSFDSAFIYEGANADEIIWKANKKIYKVNTDKIGRGTLTKRYGSEEVEFITKMYKPPENTAAERESYFAAAKSIGIDVPYSRQSMRPRASNTKISVDIVTPTEAAIGSMASVKIYIRNPLSIAKKLDLKIKATAMYYTGEVSKTIKYLSSQVSLNGSMSKIVRFDLKPEEYVQFLRNEYTIRVEACLKSGEIFAFDKKLFSFQKPSLIVNGPQAVNINKTYEMTVKVKNPLRKQLRNCYIVVEGTETQRKFFKLSDIPPLSTGIGTLKLKALFAGTETLVMRLITEELLEMQASTQLKVIGKNSYNFSKYVIKDNSRRIRGNDAVRTMNEEVRSLIEVQESLNEADTGVQKIAKEEFTCCETVRIL